MTGGRVLHFGIYNGCEIERVVLEDPAYIVWAVANVKNHGISQYWYNKAVDELEDAGDIDEPYIFPY